MKKLLITLAALGSLSGAALAERPIESSDRVDYIPKSSLSSDADLQAQGLVSGEAVTPAEQRRIDEKNENFN